MRGAVRLRYSASWSQPLACSACSGDARASVRELFRSPSRLTSLPPTGLLPQLRSRIQQSPSPAHCPTRSREFAPSTCHYSSPRNSPEQLLQLSCSVGWFPVSTRGRSGLSWIRNLEIHKRSFRRRNAQEGLLGPPRPKPNNQLCPVRAVGLTPLKLSRSG